MAQSSRTFRIFVSSTFSDLKVERNALQEKVFPRLRDLATAHGCRFQAIDLRWGVSEEAALDQQAMKICLGEIERCQKTSPRPNFIVLLGDRYGWRPLPYEIPASEFEQIINNLTDRGERLLVESWFRRDDNAIPPTYVLQPRTDEFIDAEKWALTEEKLHSILEREAGKIHLSADAALKYTASATEQEIEAGALKVPDAIEHVFCFLRDIQGFPYDGSAASFREADPEDALKQSELKERLKKQLSGNVYKYISQWQGDGPSLEHLDQLCENVYAELSKVILAETGKLEKVDPLDAEIAAHEPFGKERARVFIGRTDILSAIEKYISGSDPHPLAVWGASGSGKSALMAKAIEQAQKNGKDVLYRFIGATPESSNGRALLESLCKQISRSYGGDESSIPSEYKDLIKEFPNRLALAKPGRPLILFLDALDQISDSDNARNLAWLPAELPPNVRLTISTLPGDYLKALESKVPSQNRVEVQPMPVKDGQALLQTWFAGVQRRLQDPQEQHLLKKFRDCGLPLYLKLAFEEARLWRSYDSLLELSGDIPGILQDLFKRLSQESNHGSVLISRSLGYLAAGKNGLSEDELLDLLSLDQELQTDFRRRSPKSPKSERLPVGVWSRLFFDLEPYLTERSADGMSLLAFYHRQMSEAVGTSYLTGGEKPKRHQALAQYFSKQPHWFESNEIKIPNLRKVAELPFQQTYGEMWPGLTTTLTDLDFIEAKCTAARTHDLLVDYNLALAAGAFQGEKREIVETFEHFIRARSHILARRPDLLAQEAYNHSASVLMPERISPMFRSPGLLHRPWFRRINKPQKSVSVRLQVLTGNMREIFALAVTPDGQRVITGGGDSPGSHQGNEPIIGEVKVWDLLTGSCLYSLQGHTNCVKALAVTPDGRQVATGSWDATIKVWNLESGECIRTFQSAGSINSIVITPDGQSVLAGGQERKIVAWDLATGVYIKKFENLDSPANALAVTPDGRFLVAGGGIGLSSCWVRAWDLKKNTCVWAWEKSSAKLSLEERANKWEKFAARYILSVAVTPDGSLAFAAGGNRSDPQQRGEIKAFNMKTGECLQTLAGHDDVISNLAIAPDGLHLISASWDTTVKEWDLGTGACLQTLQSHTAALQAVAVTPDGHRAISGGTDRSIRIWSMASSDAGSGQEGHKNRVNTVAITPTGQIAGSGSADRTVKIWDLNTAICLRTLEGHAQSIKAAAVTPDGRHMLTGSDDWTVRVWSLETGECQQMLLGQAGPVEAVVLTPDGRMAVTGKGFLDKTTKIWDWASGKCLQTLGGEASSWTNALAITPDGRRLITGTGGNEYSEPGQIFIWDLETGVRLRSLDGRAGQVRGIAVTPDSKKIIAGYWANAVMVWDLKSGALIRNLEGHMDSLWTVAVTPDGQMAVTASVDKIVKVWNLETGRCVQTLEAAGFVGFVSIPWDGRHLLTCGDEAIQVWNMMTGREVACFFADDMRSHAVNSDGRRFVSGGINGDMYILALENITPGPPVGTAWRSPYDKSLAFGCPKCRKWSQVSTTAIGQELSCPQCSLSVRLNPFVIEADWQPVAQAWHTGKI